MGRRASAAPASLVGERARPVRSGTQDSLEEEARALHRRGIETAERLVRAKTLLCVREDSERLGTRPLKLELYAAGVLREVEATKEPPLASSLVEVPTCCDSLPPVRDSFWMAILGQRTLLVLDRLVDLLGTSTHWRVVQTAQIPYCRFAPFGGVARLTALDRVTVAHLPGITGARLDVRSRIGLRSSHARIIVFGTSDAHSQATERNGER